MYFGTFDPIHEGHVRVAHDVAQAARLDQVVVVVNDAAHKPEALPFEHRHGMTQARLANEPGVMLWPGGLEEYVRPDGSDPLEPIRQATGAPVVAQILGADAFDRQVRRGLLPPDLQQRVVLLAPREGVPVSIPDAYRDVVRAVEHAPDSLSSTQVRSRLQEGVDPLDLHPAVLDYVQAHGLYGT